MLNQKQAGEAIERLKCLESQDRLTQAQAIEAIELLDVLSYSYLKQARDVKVVGAARELAEKRDELGKTYDICTACYQPGHVCRCGREHDDCYHPEDKWTKEDDINCWYA